MSQFRQLFPEPPDPQNPPGAQLPFVNLKAKESSQIPATRDFDVLLTEIAQQALLATRATGAAIALAQGEEMVCRATTGGHAPDLGVHLNTTSGLSGACVQSRRVQICSDTELDPRVDVEACRTLGVRSILVAPLLRHDKLIGVIEMFSPVVLAFGERDIQTLEAYAHRILDVMERSSTHSEIALASEPAPATRSLEPPAPAFLAARAEEPRLRRRPDFATTVLTGLVIGLAILFGSLLGMRMSRERSRQLSMRGMPVAPLPKTSQPLIAGPPGPSVGEDSQPSPGGRIVEPARRTEAHDAKAGGLIVYQNDQVVFQLAPSKVPSDRNGSVSPQPGVDRQTRLSAEEAGKLVVSRVEPVYPADALAAHVQGTVSVHLTVDREGAVQRVRVFSGPPELAQAAVDAVRQWRFRPYSPEGTAEEFQTTATIDFRLP